MVWYEEVGFDENPFSTNALKRDDPLIGREKVKDELLYRIASGSMVLIVGKKGIGKTMLLKYAIDNFRGKGKVIYVNGNKVGKRLDIEKLLLKGHGILKGSLMKWKPKGMMLLLDNVQNLSMKNNKKIKYYYDQDYLKAVIFTTSNYADIQFSDSIKDRIGKRIIKLRDVKEEEVIQIVKDKLEGNEILPEEIIKEIWAVSGKDLKIMLDNCYKVCEFAIENGDEIVKKAHLKKALTKDEQDELEEKVEVCHECGEPLIEINKKWLCPKCDSFCTNCGGFIYGDENACPSCGLEFEAEEEEGEDNE